MDDKLKKLTERLYKDGLEKGEERAEEIIREAEERSKSIISDARRKAEDIMADSRKKADDLRKKVESEIRISERQALRSFKKEIEDLIIAEALDKNLSSTMNDLGNIEDFVLTVIKNWHPESTEYPSLELLLPEKRKEELVAWFKTEVSKVMAKGIEIKFHAKVKGGFQIASKEGGYRINLTDEDFSEFFKQYLRPRTRELLFGEK